MKQAKRAKKGSFLAPCRGWGRETQFLKNGCSWRATTRQQGSPLATHQNTVCERFSELLKPSGGFQACGLVARKHQGQGCLSAVPKGWHEVPVWS